MAHNVLIAFFILSAGAIMVMIGVANATRRVPLAYSDVASKGYAVRQAWFWVLFASVVASFALSIPTFPYPKAQTAGRHYQVVAQQYSFSMPESVPANTPLVFDVTSRDVNHGFGIYNPDGVLIAQVQAMPGYTNHLPVTLTKRGQYTIRCLEYCGIAHAAMHADFDVR